MNKVKNILTLFLSVAVLSVTAQDAKIESYPSGKKKSETDKKNNRIREWYEDGTPQSDRQMLSQNDYDRLTALNKEWYPNGKLKSESKVSDNKDVLYEYEYYDNGQVKMINTFLVILDDTIRDARFVYAKSYWDNGQIQAEGPENLLGEFKYTSYFKNGKISSTYSKLLGVTNGLVTEYYENGKMKEEGLVEDNIKVGVWHYYNESGKLVREETWDKGKIESEKKY